MNKTAMMIAFFALVLVALLVVTLIMIFRPDATATIIQFVGSILATASTAAVTFYMLGETNKKIAKVDHQTNGTLSALQAENAKLTNQLLAVVGTSPAQPADGLTIEGRHAAV